MKKLVLLAILISTPALADEFPVKITEQDTATVRQICDMARASTAINLEMSNGVSQYCLGLIGRMSAAAAEAKKANEAKPEK